MPTSSGKWIPFFGGIIVAACLALGAADHLLAQQPVSLGIKTGVPITSLMQTSGAIVSQGSSFPFPTQKPNYAIGPVLEIRLPSRYSLEVGVMYKGIEQHARDLTLTDLIICTDPPICENDHATYQTKVVSKVARSWEFPVAIQYHFALRSLKPYVEGGYSYNHISGAFSKAAGAFYNPQAPLPEHLMRPNPSPRNRGGFLFGGGVEMNLPLFRVSPGVRYARYDIVEKLGPQQFGPFVSQTMAESPSAFDFVLGFKTKR